MLFRQPVSVPDIFQDARIPVDAYRPTFVRSLVMVLIREAEPIWAEGAVDQGATFWFTLPQPQR